MRILLLLLLNYFVSSQRCSDQIFTESEGEIVSHDGFGDGNYDNNLECNFTILAGSQGKNNPSQKDKASLIALLTSKI